MAKREVPEGFKRCAGAPGLGFPAHDAPLADFGPNQSSKDGLYHQCRVHAKVYQADWRRRHAEKVAAENEANGVIKQTRRRVTKAMTDGPMPADELEQALTAFGGPETAEGQELLKVEADKAKAARKASRQSKAAAKAVEAETPAEPVAEDAAVA